MEVLFYYLIIYHASVLIDCLDSLKLYIRTKFCFINLQAAWIDPNAYFLVSGNNVYLYPVGINLLIQYVPNEKRKYQRECCEKKVILVKKSNHNRTETYCSNRLICFTNSCHSISENL